MKATLKLLLLLIIICFYQSSKADTTDVKRLSLVDLGVEIQAYPAGILPGIFTNLYLNKNWAINVRAALNLANRHNWGEHDNEVGKGYGGSLGARYFPTRTCQGWYFGARTDIWTMDIDWTMNEKVKRTGTTKILILQPTVEAGFIITPFSPNVNLGISAAFGLEKNIITKGEEVGQGFTSFIGVFAAYAF